MTELATLASQPTTNWRQRLIQNTLIGAVILGGLAIVATWPNNDWTLRIVLLVSWLILLATTLTPLSYEVKAGVILLLLYGLSFSEFFTVGIRDNARNFLYAFSMMALVFFGWRVSVAAWLVNVLTLTVMGALYILGPLANMGIGGFYDSTWIGLVGTVVSFALFNFLPIIGLATFQREFTSTQQRERVALDAVRLERDQLENAVAERTGQLQAAADIGRAAISVRDVNRLAPIAVQLIQQRFSLYWAGLFLLDDTGEQVVLKEARGQKDQSVIDPGFTLKLGSESLIGWVAKNRQARIARDVAEDRFYAKHPLLPETQAEAALPLLIGDKLLGVLDMQSQDPNAFAESNLQVLQTLADQLSIAFENAQLFEQAQTSISEASSRFEQTLSAAWQGAARNQPQEFTYQIRPDSSNSANAATPIEIPLRLGGEIIGTIELHDRATPLTVEEETALGTLSAQIGTALESATLFQEAQRRAEQLATASEVGRAASSVLDPNNLIERASELIQERFNMYYVGIFIADESNQWAELRYATGDAGRQLLALKHRLEIGGQSMVGTAIATGQARVAFDVGQEAVRFNNPYLPDTHSEVALPLVVGTTAIGALDVQSTDYAAFSEADLTVLQTMADQLAVAIQNARQFERTQQRVQFEQFINQFTVKLRRALDTDSIMNLAMSELQTALGARRIVARLGPEILPTIQLADTAGLPSNPVEDTPPAAGPNGKSSGNRHRPGSNGHSNGDGHLGGY